MGGQAKLHPFLVITMPKLLKNKNFWFTVVLVVGALLGWWNWPSAKDVNVNPPCACEGNINDNCDCDACSCPVPEIKIPELNLE